MRAQSADHSGSGSPQVQVVELNSDCVIYQQFELNGPEEMVSIYMKKKIKFRIHSG